MIYRLTRQWDNCFVGVNIQTYVWDAAVMRWLPRRPEEEDVASSDTSWSSSRRMIFQNEKCLAKNKRSQNGSAKPHSLKVEKKFPKRKPKTEIYDFPTHPVNGLSIHPQIENAACWIQQPVQTHRSYFSRNHLTNWWWLICLHWPIHHFDRNAIFPFLKGTEHGFSTKSF